MTTADKLKQLSTALDKDAQPLDLIALAMDYQAQAITELNRKVNILELKIEELGK